MKANLSRLAFFMQQTFAQLYSLDTDHYVFENIIFEI